MSIRAPIAFIASHSHAVLIGFALALSPALADTVQLIREGGVYVVPARINDAITLNFILDSGSADVSIPADVVSTLVRTGTVTRTDFIGTQNFETADGSVSPSATFIIHQLKVGNHVLTNVVGSVAPARASLLLGQTFLSKFHEWRIDNDRHQLVLNDGSAASPTTALATTPKVGTHAGWMPMRLPKSGEPAFAFDAPTGWASLYDEYGNLRLTADDHSCALQLSIIDDPAAGATPLSELAAQVMKAAGAKPYELEVPGAIAGLTGTEFTSEIMNDKGVAIALSVVLVRLDATHVASQATMKTKAMTANQSAALNALVGQVRLTGTAHFSSAATATQGQSQPEEIDEESRKMVCKSLAEILTQGMSEDQRSRYSELAKIDRCDAVN